MTSDQGDPFGLFSGALLWALNLLPQASLLVSRDGAAEQAA